VAFIQGAQSLSQTISGFDVGFEYTLSFDYNSRAFGADYGTLSLTVLLDGDAVVTVPADIRPADNMEGSFTQPYHHLSVTFVATATSETLTFTASTDSDRTLLLDNVSIIPTG
jgi:hypothetical protein